jgi:predicted enzyme related to lactoylglutathione lyase
MPRVMHFNLAVDDVERASEFYGKVFGWTDQKFDGPTPYWIAATGPESEPGINGTLYVRGEGQPSGICAVVDVASVDEAIARIADAGGTIHLSKLSLPGIGWIGVAADTEGVVFTVLQSDQSAE